MKRVMRIVSAVGAGASLAWGIAKALRKGRKQDTEAPPWPETPPAPFKSPVEAKPAVPKAEAPKAAAPEPEESEELVVKGVVIYRPASLLTFVNDTSADDLKEAGVKGRALSVIEANRPFADVDVLGSTAGIGRRTLQALCAAADA